MKIKERLMAAIGLEPVDRIPVMTYNFHPFRKKEWKRNAHGRYVGPEVYQPMMDAVFRTETGMLCKVSAKYHSERKERTRAQTQRKADRTITVTYIDTPRGMISGVFEKPDGLPGYHVKHFLETEQDVKKYLSLPNEPAEIDLSEALETHEEIGGLGLAYLSYPDPMYEVARLFDFQDFCIRCATDIDSIISIIEWEFERIARELGRMLAKAEGHDFIFYAAGPELLTPPMFSPQDFKRMIVPYETKLVEKIKQCGYHSAIHCHGKVGKVLDQFIAMGIHALEPLEPPPQGDINLTDALGKAQGQLCLMGYIQDQDLYTAQKGEMAQKVCSIRGIIDDRTGYIMTSSATPYMENPPEAFVRNYVEYLEAAAFSA